MTLHPYSYYTKPEEWQTCYTKHSADGESPTLCYEDLIDTIVDLYDKLAKLEARLDQEDSYRYEQND
jgi:hypothetical protein